MRLYIMRHAEAEEAAPGRPDAERALTDKGHRRAQEAGEALRALEERPDVILTSPLRRAKQTAEDVAAEIGVPVYEARALAGAVTLNSLRDLLEEHDRPERVLIVGHEPDCSRLVGELIGGAAVEMKKGAIACLDCKAISPGGAALCWLAPGRMLSLIAG